MSMMNGSSGMLSPYTIPSALSIQFSFRILLDSNFSSNYSLRKKKSSKYSPISTNATVNSSFSSIIKATAGDMSNSNTNVTSSYNLHEQSEKRFSKWLAEIEQSLEFIEKRLAAESAFSNNDTTFNNDDGVLYSNISEMQQMHMNYFEKIKVSLLLASLISQ